MDYGGNYSTPSYGAQGGASGGGFMAGSQGGSQANKGNINQWKETLRPCTIKQVLDATQPHPDADFKIDDVEVSQITFVGQIRNISTQTTNVTYKLDDGTGTVEAKVWIDTDSAAMDLGGAGNKNSSGLAEDQWVRIWGRMKAFGNRRHVGAHVIRPVTDKMEITYHLLEATYVHLYYTRGPLEPSGGRPAQVDGGQYGGDDTGGGRSMPNLSPNARRVFQCLKETPQNNEGLNMQHVAASLRMPLTEVAKAGDELLTQSLIFTTVDDNTWAILDM